MSDTVQKKKGLPVWAWVVIVIIVLAAIGSAAGGNKSTDNGAKVVSSSSSSSSSSSLKSLFAVNETVELNGKQLTVTKVTRDYQSGNPYTTAKSGYEYVVVNVKLQNGSDSKISYNPYDFKIKDSNGNITSTSYAVGVESLSFGELAPGGKVSGDLVFEVPKGDDKIELQYTASYWGDKTINVKL